MSVSALDAPGVELDGVTKTFSGSVVALERVDLKIGDGEFVAVVGPSGCGKSTMMRLIARLASPSSGHIAVFGDLSDEPPPGMSIVFQNHVLLAWRTILDNVLFPADMTNQSRAKLLPKALELLESVGLKDFAKSYPHELSGGMKQRASIARALLLEPKLLLMDEQYGQPGDRQSQETQAYRLVMVLHTHDTLPSTVSVSRATGQRAVRDSGQPGRIKLAIGISADHQYFTTERRKRL